MSLPEDVPCVVFPETAGLLSRQGVWSARFDLEYPSALAFLQSRREGQWIAYAMSDDSGRMAPFTRALLDALHLPAVTSPIDRVALLARPGSRAGAVSRSTLEIPFGGAVGDTAAPATFAIHALREPRILVNDRLVAQTTHGAALVVFDAASPRDIDVRLLGSVADDRGWPTIEDARLSPHFLLERLSASPPAAPVVGLRSVQVSFGGDGAAWFGDGWYRARGTPRRRVPLDRRARCGPRRARKPLATASDPAHGAPGRGSGREEQALRALERRGPAVASALDRPARRRVARSGPARSPGPEYADTPG